MPLLPFQPVATDDVLRLGELVATLDAPFGNDCTPANVFLLRNKYKIQLAVLPQGQGILRYYNEPARFCGYGFPLLAQPSTVECLHAALDAIAADAAARQRPLEFCALSPAQLAALQAWRPDGCVRCDGDDSDYFYAAAALATLEGAALRKKRNRLHQVERHLSENCSTWNMERVEKVAFPALRTIADAWQEVKGALPSERALLEEAFVHWEALSLSGIMLLVDGLPRAFSIMARTNASTWDVLVEKCHPDARDLSPLLVRAGGEFALHHGARWINREEDLGVPGLRKAKLAWRPEFLLEKYCFELT